MKLLTPVVDEHGILQVGGQLDRAELSYDTAHPMILPKKIHITQLIVADIHNNHCQHAGVNHVLAQVQNQYWVIDGRQEVKNWEKECKVCERRRVQLSVQIMAPLPRTRVRTTPLQSAVLITLAPSQPRLLKEFLLKGICACLCAQQPEQCI